MSQASLIPLPLYSLLPWLPAIAAIATVISALHFNNGRTLLAVAMIFMLYLLLRFAPDSPVLLRESAIQLFSLNLIIITLYSERGVLNLNGFLRLLAIFLQAGTLYWLAFNQQAYLYHWFMPAFNLPAAANLFMPATVVLTLLIALIILFFHLLYLQTSLEANLLIILGVQHWLLFGAADSVQLDTFTSLNLLLLMRVIIKESHNIGFKDELTGLPSRRALTARLRTLGGRYSLALVDIDHYQRIKNTYGQDTGEQALKLVSSRLRRLNAGKAYRYGTQSFCILFPGKPHKQVLKPLEGLRLTLEKTKMKLRGRNRPKDIKKGQALRSGEHLNKKNITVTVSIGVGDRRSHNDPLSAADTALCRAKDQGRNRICF
jgi:GGDEF domain-containing protein